MRAPWPRRMGAAYAKAFGHGMDSTSATTSSTDAGDKRPPFELTPGVCAMLEKLGGNTPFRGMQTTSG